MGKNVLFSFEALVCAAWAVAKAKGALAYCAWLNGQYHVGPPTTFLITLLISGSLSAQRLLIRHTIFVIYFFLDLKLLARLQHHAVADYQYFQ